MYQLITTSHFEWQLARFQRSHPELRRRIAQTLVELERDPFQPHLHLHPLAGRLAGLHAVSVTYAYRIVLTIQVSEREITLLNIGSHDEVYRECRLSVTPHRPYAVSDRIGNDIHYSPSYNDQMKDATYAGLVTIEEYLRIEEASPLRHEYVSGVLYAMTGGIRRHSAIVGNLYVAILPESRRHGCDLYPGDVKTQVNADRIYYPDLIATCDPDDRDPLIVAMPCLVIEILSPSTEATDRREKASAYRTIDSLRSYLIVHQDQVRVEHYFRDKHDVWNLEFVTEGSVTLRCPAMALQLADIYDRLPAPDR
ncbi:MAG: Uma2 family endonuclease [Chloroflexota bacterium]|nr:Uma2 family endonuclease [Chloroflexota bacterium]